MFPRAGRAPISPTAALKLLCTAALAATLAACGGSSYYNPYPTTTYVSTSTYTVGGTVTGLTVSSLVLANAGATVSIPAGSTTWAFPNPFNPGTSYQVTIQSQPTGESCAITAGASGTNTGNVDNVSVVCGFGEWIWNSGSSTANAGGVYGTQGTAAAGNVPGARYGASAWTDAAGNFWLFGGIGYAASGAAAGGSTAYLNDLWKYNPHSKLWTWVSGGNTADAAGVYGTQGTAAAGNVPGARYSASSWVDSSGHLWLFGGTGYDSSGATGRLNDLWQFSPATGQWTWLSGGSTIDAAGVYGTQGTPAAGNVPGARYAASSWVDSSGNLWLFGGFGNDAAGAAGNLNDLWRYSPTARQWTWIAGGSGQNAIGVYGAQGTAAAANVPGARYAGSTWVDSSGNLWLFGGYGNDSTGTAGKLNDLWEYSPSVKQWTWIAGVDVIGGNGFYGTLGTAALGNSPGARQGARTWIDSTGNLWLFGGVGYDATGAVGNLNDLWEFNPTNKDWTWVSGSDLANPSGLYGTLGTGVVTSVPGGRDSMNTWIDASGNLWLFGGYGYDSAGAQGYLNDLWQYTPSGG